MAERWWDKFKSKPNRLKELIHQSERRDWIKEIEHTRGYILICTAIENEIEWCNKSVRDLVGKQKFSDAERVEHYMTALEFIKETILQWNVEGDIAQDVLCNRLKDLDSMSVEVSSQAQPNTNQPS